MGAITDASVLSSEMLNRILREIVEPTLAGAREEGFAFRGVLFVGLMLTSRGPRVLEYNVRFGDPETQAILVRLKSDLLEIFAAIAGGRLGATRVDWASESSACVVLASRGYPGKYETGAHIAGLDRGSSESHVEVFHAGTSRAANGDWLTAGGRVLGVTATGESLDEALRRCYHAVDKIYWEGVHCRRDIGQFAEAPKPSSAKEG
jgi:phosphoribosylamine--glycine ligase